MSERRAGVWAGFYQTLLKCCISMSDTSNEIRDNSLGGFRSENAFC